MKKLSDPAKTVVILTQHGMMGQITAWSSITQFKNEQISGTGFKKPFFLKKFIFPQYMGGKHRYFPKIPQR